MELMDKNVSSWGNEVFNFYISSNDFNFLQIDNNTITNADQLG